MAFDSDGNLYVSTGDNADPCCERLRPDRRAAGPGTRTRSAPRPTRTTCAARSCASTRRPTARTRSPTGNLFPPGTAKTRPEIYVMGLRNPYRIHDRPGDRLAVLGRGRPRRAGATTAARGPMGYDEFNLAKQAGNFGWPHVHRRQQALRRRTTSPPALPAAPFDCAGGPIEQLAEQHRASPSCRRRSRRWLRYPYDASREWPELGSGGRLAIGGPTYHYDADLDSETKLPEYYDDTDVHRRLDPQRDLRGEARRGRQRRSPSTGSCRTGVPAARSTWSSARTVRCTSSSGAPTTAAPAAATPTSTRASTSSTTCRPATGTDRRRLRDADLRAGAARRSEFSAAGSADPTGPEHHLRLGLRRQRHDRLHRRRTRATPTPRTVTSWPA